MSSEVDSPIEEHDQLTILNVTFLWTIQRFSDYKCLKEIESPTFVAESDTSYKLQLFLYPMTDEEDTDSALEIDFKCNNVPKYPVEFTFTKLNDKGEKLESYNAVTEKRKEFVYAIENFMNIKDAQNSNSDLVNENDEVRILCQIKTIKKSVYSLFVQSSSQSQISKDIETFFDNEKFSDVVLVDETGKKIHAHKLLLAARSPVFAGMFIHNMKEVQEGVVTIPNIKYECLREMLRFIYTGKVENLEDIAVDLLAASNQYGLNELKEMCESVLSGNLIAEEAIATLVIADNHNAATLKKKVLRFIVKNSKEIITTEGFKALKASHIDLVKEILCAIVEN